VETGDKNRGVPHRYTLFCEERLGKINAKDVELFLNWLVHESVDYFGTTGHFSENFAGEAVNWSGAVNFHWMQMSLLC